MEESELQPTSPELDLSVLQYSYMYQLSFSSLDAANRYVYPHIIRDTY